MRSEHLYETRPDERKGHVMSDEHTNKQRHGHTNQVKPLSTKRSADWWADMGLFACAGLLGAVVVLTFVFGGKFLLNAAEDHNNAIAERAELRRCRLEQYVTTRTGHVPLETVVLNMKKTGTGPKIAGDGLVLAANVDPLDVFVAAADECAGILSPQYVDDPDPQRCRIEQYILAYLSSSRQVAALPADLELDTKNNDDVTEITINGYVTFTDVDTAVMLSRYEACDPQLEP